MTIGVGLLAPPFFAQGQPGPLAELIDAILARVRRQVEEEEPGKVEGGGCVGG